MTRVAGWDYSHRPTWTIHLEQCLARVESPEYTYFGHLATFAESALDVSFTDVLEQWTPAALSELDAIVIAAPAAEGVETGFGADRDFDEGEIAAALAFVESGGGLLVIAEYMHSYWRRNLNDLLSAFGIVVNDDQLAVSANEGSSVITRHFTCSALSRHPITSNVQSFTYQRGASLTTRAPASPVARAPGGDVVLAAAPYGMGRVVVIGDSDLFSIPFLGHANNLTLFLNALAWCTGEDIPKPAVIAASDERLRSRIFDLTGVRQRIPFDSLPPEDVIVIENAGLESTDAVDLDPYVPANVEPFLERACLWAQRSLPERGRAALLRMRRQSTPSGALLIRGLPVDEHLPPTPANSRRSPDKGTYISELVLGGISELLGHTINYSQEKDGELFQAICPTASNAEMLSSESSKIVLDFHTETAFHPFMPDFVLLLCLRPDHEGIAETFSAGIRDLLPLLSLRVRATLFERQFHTGIDFSFGSPNAAKGNAECTAVLYGRPHDPFLKYDLDLMTGITPAGSAALDAMRTAANAVKRGVKLEPGDLLIVDNRRAVHGRSAFTPRYDGADRWLMRTYVVRDVIGSEAERLAAERVIDLHFAL